MTEQQLLERCEQQAVEISRLKESVAILEHRLASVPEITRKELLHGMARAGRNCGQHYGCSLAADMLKKELP